MTYELVVGLEIHAQLITATKAFCRCPNRYGDPPNTLTCPTCLGMPGALPVLNQEVMKQAARLALVLNATIHSRSKFDRKNYFYPDLPKGYQISQYDEPFSSGGELEIPSRTGARRIRITRAHIEEDAGKSMHLPDGTTIVDMNRCGVPLVEIVTEPDFRHPADASAFVSTARELFRYIGVCDGNMERGSLRCDVNISARPLGSSDLNERTEIKNLNSIRSVERAIQVEFERQIVIYEAGDKVHRETLLWDEDTETLRAMRRKEGSDDYRYFPEPDLVELHVSREYISGIKTALPELPWERRRRYREDLHLHDEAVSLLASDRGLGDYFDALLREGVSANSAASWIQGEVRRVLVESGQTIAEFSIRPRQLAELMSAVQAEIISLSTAKDVFRRMLSEGRSAAEIITREGMSQLADANELRQAAELVIARHAAEVERYRSGKKNLLGFFVGETMKATGGRANPKVLSQVIQDLLNT